MSCPPSIPATGLLLARGVGHGGIGVCPVFLHGSRRLGCCPGLRGLGKAWELCQSRGTAGAEATRTLCPLSAHLCEGLPGEGQLCLPLLQGCHPAHLGSKGCAGVWCLLSRGCSKKGMSWLDVILGEPGWDVMVPAGLGAAELGSSPCCGTHQCFPYQPWHCLILIKAWMVPELQKCSAHSVTCPCP